MVRKKLAAAALEALERSGIKKTSVEELARAAGISKGAYYLFFKTKEELFFEVLEGLEVRFRNEVVGLVFSDGFSPRESFGRFLGRFISGLETIPVLAKMNKADYESLLAHVPQERLATHQRRDREELEQFYASFQEKGIFRKLPEGTFSALMAALIAFVLQRSDLGQETYQLARNAMIAMMQEYLILDQN